MKLSHAPRQIEGRSALRKTLANSGFVPPQNRSGQPGRAGKHFVSDLKTFADETEGSPIGHGDLPAGPADTKQFRGYPVGTRSKHGSEHRKNDVETVIGEGKFLGVAFFEADIQVFSGGPLPRLRQKVGSDIDASDRGSGSRCRNRRIARAACDIEQAAAGLDGSAPDEILSGVGDEGRDAAEVARHPTGFHAGL